MVKKSAEGHLYKVWRALGQQRELSRPQYHKSWMAMYLAQGCAIIGLHRMAYESEQAPAPEDILHDCALVMHQYNVPNLSQR